MAFRYGKADIRAAAFDRPRHLDGDIGRGGEDFDRMDRPRDIDRDRDRRDRESERLDRRRPRSRTRSRSPRHMERRRSLERDRDRERFRDRDDRDRRSPGRDRERRDRMEREKPMDRPRDREDRLRERRSPMDRPDRLREEERFPPDDSFEGFNAPPPPPLPPPPPPPAGFNGLNGRSNFGRSSGFGPAAPPLGGFNDVCFVCGGIGHMGRDCPSNPDDMPKMRGLGRRSVDMDIGERSKGLGPDDPSFPKCFECGKRGHVAREVGFFRVFGCLEPGPQLGG